MRAVGGVHGIPLRRANLGAADVVDDDDDDDDSDDGNDNDDDDDDDDDDGYDDVDDDDGHDYGTGNDATFMMVMIMMVVMTTALTISPFTKDTMNDNPGCGISERNCCIQNATPGYGTGSFGGTNLYNKDASL